MTSQDWFLETLCPATFQESRLNNIVAKLFEMNASYEISSKYYKKGIGAVFTMTY